MYLNIINYEWEKINLDIVRLNCIFSKIFLINITMYIISLY